MPFYKCFSFLAEKVNFIDFEFCSYNYEAHDIAMHFCDYAGSDCTVILCFTTVTWQIITW